VRSLLAKASAPKDAAALAAFRVLFGLLMLGSVVRYFQMGWVQTFYVEPAHHLTYWGFDWVRPFPEPGMTIVFVVLGVFAACIALGLFYRAASIGFFALFTYVHLLDVANYLNHYYLVSVLALLMSVLPLHRAYSLDARLFPSLRSTTLPAWVTWLLQAQVAIVYVNAGLAKLNADWLLHAQPLEIWLHSRSAMPVIGPLFEEHWVALAMSWAGFLYDTTIPLWLSLRRTRPFAYLVVCTFHVMTHLLFNIGIFPFVMTIAATVFFDPSWPRAIAAKLRRVPMPSIEGRRSLSSAAIPVALCAAWLAVQVAVPLRIHLYEGNWRWHEQGMRFGWRVMVREKNGVVSYRVRMDGDARERVVSPTQYLTLHQEREMSVQPDLILQLAHRIASDLRARGHHDVEVRADAWASLNGRPSARLIDPDVDLARVDDGVMPAAWILPAPDGPPIRLLSPSERASALANR
jgi:vitamin K-dependent gamma-carboxylase